MISNSNLILKTQEITELTAHDFFSLVTGWIDCTVTMQAPHPPSEHINFVPLSSALVRINVFKVVSTGTVDELTKVIDNDLANLF